MLIWDIRFDFPAQIDNLEVWVHLSNETKHGCLGYIGDYTTQFWRDCNSIIDL